MVEWLHRKEGRALRNIIPAYVRLRVVAVWGRPGELHASPQQSVAFKYIVCFSPSVNSFFEQVGSGTVTCTPTSGLPVFCLPEAW